MLSVLSPAKVNLFLNIRPRRADGFHELCTVFQAVRLWDRLDVTPRTGEARDIAFACNVPDLENDPERNLVVRAYRLFWQATGMPPLGLHVHLEKDIPMQAGLGGGSGNAAAMLVILNHLTHAGLSEERLRHLGSKLGSDVPFFISGGLALGTGRGEIIQPLPAELTADLPLVIVKPRNVNINTAAAYQHYATEGRYESRSPDHLLSALRDARHHRHAPEIGQLASYLQNDFEPLLLKEYPILAQMARQMRETGIQRPLLSGSGSAMLGFAEPTQALRQDLAERLPESQYDIYWTQTHPGGIRQVETPAEALF